MKRTIVARRAAGADSLDARRGAWILLALATLAAVVGPLWEARQRAPEGTVRAYLAAVERRDLDGALAELAPDVRVAEREAVARQLGNGYRVESLVLGAPSVADRMLGRPGPPAWAVVAAEVVPTVGESWKSSSNEVLFLVER